MGILDQHSYRAHNTDAYVSRRQGGYLRWLLTTKPKIGKLLFNMAWRTWYLAPIANRSDTPRAVLESMGLGVLKYDENRRPRTYPAGKESIRTVSPAMMRFAVMLFEAQPDLQVITYRFDLVPHDQLHDTPATWFRTATFTRSDGPNRAQGYIAYNDQIEYQVIDAVIQAQLNK